MSKQNNVLRPKFDEYAIPAFAKETVATPVRVETLLDIVRRPRFADTVGELYVIDTYIKPLTGVQMDNFGNFWLVIPKPDGSEPTTLFSAHTDTVHKQKATEPYKLALKETMLTVKGGGVLGADDGTGIWILLNLIEARVPGIYIFHREEEIGGNGSTFIARNHAALLEPLHRAIAFDRKGTTDIITHQGGERCCSEAFASAFAAQLNLTEGFKFAGDDTGSFTDTKNYTLLIPECTNLAVGYYDQHTTHECQDLSFVTRLVNRLIEVDWDALPTERDKAVVEDLWSSWGRNSRWTDYPAFNTSKPVVDAASRDFEDMIEIIENCPDEIASLLQELGYDAFELERALNARS
jgi:hypothetical protein